MVFAEELRKRFRLPVHLWDERLTSAEANRLLRETDLSIEKRGKAVDRMAAILILQGWMESKKASGFRLPASGSGIDVCSILGLNRFNFHVFLVPVIITIAAFSKYVTSRPTERSFMGDGRSLVTIASV